MCKIKKMKLKIMSVIMLVVMLTLELSPFAVKAAGERLQFYCPGSVSVGWDSYNQKNVFYGNATLGGITAYCIDYTRTLPSGTMSFSRYLSDQGLAILANGYPYRSASAMGLANNEEAYMATQMALWEVLNRTGESKKSGCVFRVENVTPKAGMEGFFERTTSAAKRLVALAETSPVTDNPTLVVNTQSVTSRTLGSDTLIGPYNVRVDGMRTSKLTGISASLSGAPGSARFTDGNGNNKSTLSNGDSIYVRLSSSEDTKSFKINFSANFDRTVGKIYSTSGNVQDYVIVDTIPNSANTSVTVDWNKGTTYTGEIELVKVDQDSQPVQGAEFSLVDSHGSVLATSTTGTDGKINFYNVPAGEYTLEEKSAPAGYMVKTKSTNVSVKSNQKTPVRVVNERITGQLVITKVDDASRPLKGATFEIYKSDGSLLTRVTTDANGRASVNVEYGKYYFKEVSAPEGYTIDDTVYSFSVTEDNRTYYKTVVDETYKGSIVIIKKDSDGKRIPNVKFNILDEKGNVVITITTNSNGVAGAKNLPYGKYYYQEVEAPDNVIMDTEKHEFSITQDNQVIEKEVINNLAKGKIEITKVDSDSKKIPNVKFNILDENGRVVDTIVTDENGIATSKDLPAGNYYYQEVEVPTGYIIDTEKHPFFVTNNTVIRKTVVNDIASGKLKIVKYDNAGETISGVKFNILDASGKVVDTIVTDGSGVATSKSLPLGTYYYQEVEAPAGFKVDNNKYEFRLSENGATITKNVVNFYEQGKLKIIKVDENSTPIAGVKFNILDKNKQVIDTIVTNDSGIAQSKDLERGTYYYQEIEAPDGIIIDNNIYEFTVSYDGQIVVKNIINYYKKGSLEITKYDSNGKLLQGVKFQILDEEQREVAVIETDENGVARIDDLKFGKYYYKEIEAPDGVVMDETPHEFYITEDKQVVKKKVINEVKKGTLKIIKVDENDVPLAGVKFNIYDSNKEFIETIVTDSTGVATSKELEKGTYYYQEIEAPDGIIVDNTMYEFVLSENGQNVVKNMVNYYAKGKLKIVKVDSNEKPLQNVKFEITNENGEVVDTIVTDVNGEATSKDLPLGRYYYKETEAPDDVVMDTEKHEFLLTENNQVITKKIVNELKKGYLKIIKVDENNVPLAGVKFNILDKNKQVVDTIVTDSRGIATSKELEEGTYYYQEIEAPDGIIVDGTLYEFTIEEDGQNVIKNMVNYYAKGKLVIYKTASDKRPLQNVKFEITNENGEVVDTIVTDKDGRAETKDLPLGTYYYQETDAPDYVIMDTEKHEFTLSQNEEIVTARIENKLREGKIHIHKVDETDVNIPNVKFNILDGKGEIVDTIVTDENGNATSKELPDGSYFYQEVEAPDKYVIDGELKPFELYNGVDIYVEVVNYEKTGRLHIIKVDENSVPLEGIKFEIYNSNKELIDTIVTNRQGIAISKELEKGTYYYKEVEAPEGIILDDKMYEFTIEYDGQNVIANITNYYKKGNLEITKKDSNGKLLQGVKFEITNENGEVVDTLVTDEYGKAYSKKLLLGKYYYKETEAPENVVMDTERHEFVLDEDGKIITVEVENKVIEGKLHIIKVDENNIPLEGIKFNIYTLDGTLVDTIVTDKNGVAESKYLEKGTYYYQEVEAPANIVIDTEKHEFTIEYDGQNVIGELVNYYVKGKLQIVKVDASTGDRLKGAKFMVLNENREEVEVIETDENGIATTSELLYGTYYFKEIEAPSRYILDSTEYSFTITNDNDLIESVVYNEKQVLPQTGGMLSSNTKIVLIISAITVLFYIISKVLEKRNDEI